MFNRKKQRRQVAAGVVQSVMGGSGKQTSSSGRKSTAQPRPHIVVPPGGIGPIADPNENDVLCGRGGRINSHVGNRKFREIIQYRKKEYLAPTTKKLEKAHIAAAIVNDIRSMQPAGRFLKEDGKSGMWYDIGDAKAIKKTGQALREDAPEIRPEIDGKSVSPDRASKSPKNGSASKQKKSPIPKTVNTTSHRNGSSNGTSFDAHGPQLLPSEAQTRTTSDQQGRAVMPPPFHINQQANPYLNQGGQQQQQIGNSFEARNIPIQAPQDVQAQYLNDVQQQQALFLSTRQEELNAFGRPFHPPGSALGSEGTMSSISGLTDPVRSTMSGSTRSPPRTQFGTRVTSRGSSGLHSARFSDMSSNNMMSLGGGGDMMSMGGSLISRTSSFPDMSSIMGGDSSSWNKGMMDNDSDLAQLRSVLSGTASRGGQYGTGGSSLMSITSGTSSSQWMANADFDVRSMNMSDMSSGLNALDLA